MIDRFHMMSVFLGMILLLSACAPLTPEISETERQELEHISPYSNDSGYMQALSKLRGMILASSTIPSGIVIQPEPITNKSVSTYGQGEDIPIDVTNIVITALSKLTSQKIKIVPYDPKFATASHLQPNIILAGSITEFDKDIEVSRNDLRLDALLDHGSSNAEGGGDADNNKKMSRITIDFYLLNAATQEVLPGTSISNTIRVLEIEKGRGFNFEIFGSGINVNGRIRSTQGFHRAVRNLIGYSIVQLVGRAFELHYEPLLGISTKDQVITQSSVDSQQLTSPAASSALQKNDQKRKKRKKNNSSRVNATPGFAAAEQDIHMNQRPHSVAPAPAMNVKIALVQQHGADLKEVITAGEELKSGSQYRIIVKPEQNCCLYVFQKDSTNSLFTIFPTSNSQQNLDNPLLKGKVYFFPNKEHSFFLDEQRGREQIYFYITAKHDRYLEKLLRQYSQTGKSGESSRKKAVGQKITAYLATKDIVSPLRYSQELVGRNHSLEMTEIRSLSGKNMYVLPFMHR